jgi:hypothetical protein
MHYPHYPADEAEWFIYVPRGHEHKVAWFGEGDRVAFYEVGRGPARQGKNVKRPTGRSAVVCVARGSGPPRSAGFQEVYSDGTSTAFTLECPCCDQVFQHVLPRDEVSGALGYPLNLRGLGGGAGFIEVSCEEFQRLQAAFLAAPAD